MKKESTYKNSTFEIIPILNKDQLESNKEIVELFFDLYRSKDCFPDPNELEDPDFIKGRITRRNREISQIDVDKNEPDPFTHLLCFNLIKHNRKKEFVAGCVAEFYPDSQCILITYIFVKKDYRGIEIGEEKKKIAEIIIKNKEQGLPNLVKMIEKEYDRRVKAVFFESNNPSMTRIEDDSMPPAKRIKFFKKMGAKRIGFNYIQPPLGDDLEPVNNLYLLCFPELTNSDILMPVQTVILFLIELAKSLDKNKTHGKYGLDNYLHDKHKLQNLSIEEEIKLKGLLLNEQNILQYMLDDLIENRYRDWDELVLYLEEVPNTEDPKFHFERASVAFEFLIDEDYSKPDNFRLHRDTAELPEETKKSFWSSCVVLCNLICENLKFFWWIITRNKIALGKREIRRRKERQQKEELLKLAKLKNSYCTICHSYETDLFSYKNQLDPPYYTKYFTAKSDTITVRFPSTLQYTSEGRKESYITASENLIDGFSYLRMRFNVCYTYFFRSNIRVWHIIFSSLEGTPINELEIIKLTKFFTGTQENQSYFDKKEGILNKILFSHDDKNFKNLIPFLFGDNNKGGILDVHYNITEQAKEDAFFHENDKVLSYDNLKNGVVQLDLSYVKPIDSLQSDKLVVELPELFNGLYNKFHPSLGDKKVEKIYNDSTYIFDALCGTTLGIFDYDRMGFEEVEDTLAPRPSSITSTSFLTINRGALTSYSIGDDVLASSWDSIGINPYLIIPASVLAQNEYVSIDADKRLEHLLKNSRDRSTRSRMNINDLISERDEIDDLLNDDYLPNPFNYKTEQDLYDYGIKHRGIENRYYNAKLMLSQLDTIIDQRQSEANNSYQRNIQFLLAVIGLVQLFSIIYTVIEKTQNNEDVKKLENQFLATEDVIIVSVVIFFISFGFLFLPLVFWEMKARQNPLLWKLLSRKRKTKKRKRNSI